MSVLWFFYFLSLVHAIDNEAEFSVQLPDMEGYAIADSNLCYQVSPEDVPKSAEIHKAPKKSKCEEYCTRRSDCLGYEYHTTLKMCILIKDRNVVPPEKAFQPCTDTEATVGLKHQCPKGSFGENGKYPCYTCPDPLMTTLDTARTTLEHCLCPAGYYREIGQCKECPVNSFSAQGATECTSCPSRMYTENAKSTSFSDCQCAEGLQVSLGKDGRSSLDDYCECPLGMVIDDQGTVGEYADDTCICPSHLELNQQGTKTVYTDDKCTCPSPLILVGGASTEAFDDDICALPCPNSLVRHPVTGDCSCPNGLFQMGLHTAIFDDDTCICPNGLIQNDNKTPSNYGDDTCSCPGNLIHSKFDTATYYVDDVCLCPEGFVLAEGKETTTFADDVCIPESETTSTCGDYQIRDDSGACVCLEGLILDGKACKCPDGLSLEPTESIYKPFICK